MLTGFLSGPRKNERFASSGLAVVVAADYMIHLYGNSFEPSPKHDYCVLIACINRFCTQNYEPLHSAAQRVPYTNAA